MQFMTINQAAKAVGLPHSRLRRMRLEGRLPGFYGGNRYYVNMDRLRTQLEEDSRPSAKDSGEISA